MALGQSSRVGENRRQIQIGYAFFETAAELGVIDKEFGLRALL